MKTELERERETLARSERDITDGRERLTRQEEIVARLARAGQDTTQAERLARAMQATLREWQRHQVLILQHIAWLERKETS